MQNIHPLLSDFLEELKTFKEGAFLDKTISIFYNDWSLNPDFEDDYSERVYINTAKLKDIDTKKYKSYIWRKGNFMKNFTEFLSESS